MSETMNTYTAAKGDRFVERTTGNVYTVDYVLPAGSFATKESDGPHVHMRLASGYGVTVTWGGYYVPTMFYPAQ